jgi:hypothetical protein
VNPSPPAYRSQKRCLHGSFFIFRPVTSSPREQVIPRPPGRQPGLTPPKPSPPNPNSPPATYRSLKWCLHSPFSAFCLIASPPREQVVSRTPGCQVGITPPKPSPPNVNPSPPAYRSHKRCLHGPFYRYFVPKTTSLARRPIAAPHLLKLALHHPKMHSTTWIRRPPHVFLRKPSPRGLVSGF